MILEYPVHKNATIKIIIYVTGLNEATGSNTQNIKVQAIFEARQVFTLKRALNNLRLG